jgi:hypothetical protein
MKNTKKSKQNSKEENEKFFCEDCILDAMCCDGCQKFAEYCDNRLLGVYTIPEMFVKTLSRYLRSIRTAEDFLHNSFFGHNIMVARNKIIEQRIRNKAIENLLRQAEKLNF